MTARTVPEWIGRTPDEQPPPRVRLRVFGQYQGRCQCGRCDSRKIMVGEKWQVDHKIALINGGENRERNLVPVLTDHHKLKTATDVAEKAVVYAKRARHVGIRKPRTITRWRKFDGTPVYAPKER